MGRAASLNESSQDSGIASGRIEQPIRAVMDDQSYDGSACGSRTCPATFRRWGHGLRQRRHVALAISAATGDRSEPTIEAVGQAATGHESTHTADGQKASKIVCHGHAHGCLSTRERNAQLCPVCPVSHDNKKRIPFKWGNPELLEARPADSQLAEGSTNQLIGARFGRLSHGVSA